MLLRRLYRVKDDSIWKTYILNETALERILEKYAEMPKKKFKVKNKEAVLHNRIPSLNMPMFRLEYCNPSKNDAIAYVESMEFIKDKRSKSRYRMFADIVILDNNIIKYKKDLDKYYIYPRVTLLKSNRRVVDDIYGFDIELKNTGEVK